jgi:ring-1,2-phenylacetyl-CoA epoxidase subunit PaaE
MATHFYPLRVKKVNQETNQCVSVSFEMPSDLEQAFAYRQGQYLTLRTYIKGQEVRRNYSLCSSPLDNEWKVAIKKVEGGLFSTWANTELKAGMEVEVMPPIGKFFTPLQPQQQKNYLAIAAGSGITPILSIISTTLRTEPGSRFTLIYGNRNKGSIIFKEELEALKDKFMDRFRLIHILSRERTEADILHGRITAEKMEALATQLVNLSKVDECFLCGPEQMTLEALNTVKEAGLPKEKIHVELFTSSASHKPIHRNDASESHKQPMAAITLKIDGIESSFPLEYMGNSILDAALLQGADLPYACKGGVCCTCKAKLLEGKVDMDVVYGLEPDEIAAGYILTCQSHPRTPVVKVDYDI